MKIVTTIVLFVSLTCVHSLGGREQMTEADLNSKEVVSAVKFATSQIRSKKQRNGEVGECTELQSKPLRGSSQFVNGIKYSFELKISPFPINDKFCAGKINSSTGQFKPEICEVEIWSHPWKTSHPYEMIRSTCLKIED